MTTTNLQQENIANLTSIWKSIGTIYNAYTNKPELEWVDMPNKTWLNRLWIHSELSNRTVTQAKQILQSSPNQICIPHASHLTEIHNALFIDHGFSPLFHQIGMSLKLTHPYSERQPNINIKRVNTNLEAKLWSEYFEQSFGYYICPETINTTKNDIQYYITYINQEPIGTLILHKTNTILGVHAMGVLPTMRRKGYAEQIMKKIINHSIDLNIEFITLQASEMGKKVYDKLGFKTDFRLTTYGLI